MMGRNCEKGIAFFSTFLALFLSSVGWARDSVAPASAGQKPVIVFLDFNLSSLEVKSAQEAADSINVGLRVIPSIPDPEKVAIKKIRAQIKDLQAEYESISEKVLKYRQRPVLFSFISRWNYEDKARDLAAKIKPLQEILRKYEKTYELNDFAIRTAFRNMSHSGETMVGLVISGHSRGDQFWGSIGERSVLNRDEVFGILQDYPRFTSKLRSVFLWGCYGGTYESVLAWTEAIPQIKNIFGFSGSAPGNLSRESYTGLKILMQKEPELSDSTSGPEMEKWFKGLSIFRETFFVAKSRDWWISTHDALASFRGMRVDCELAQRNLGPHVRTYRRFFEASQPGFEFPPNEKELRANGAVSPLRVAYEAFQKVFICQDDIPDMPDRSLVVALIHFEQVQQSFSRARYREIERWNKLSLKLGEKSQADKISTPKGLSFGVVSRKEIREWSSRVGQWLEDFSAENVKRIRSDKGFREDFRFMEEFYNQHLAPELDQLDAVPPTWTTE